MAMKQASRTLNLKGPFAENDLVLTSFEGQEELSRLFRFRLDMLSDNAAIDAKDIVGKNVTFSVRKADESLRHFNGFVSRFGAGDEDENGRRSYRAEVVPWFWFLTRHADCRIFQDKSLKDIVEQVFGDRGFTDFKISLKGKHPKREYCVQYRETDFAFLSRLMEEEGVWYTFQHEDGKHTMLIADKAGDYFDCDQKEVDYPTDFGAYAMEDHVRRWEHMYEFRSGKVSHADYNVLNEGGDNFLKPSGPMDVDSKTLMKWSGVDKYELFDYPGVYTKKDEGKEFADSRMEAEELGHDVVEGEGIVRTFTAGGKFKIRQHRASSEEGKSFVLTKIEHRGKETRGYSTGAAPDEGYSNRFTCIPDSANFRPERTTPKSRVQGVQIAVVIGDDEIPVDKYGRVRVRFPWDRQGKKEDTGSCWIRVSQNWASQEWGGLFIPHKDDEVIVAFVDGDPDRPAIVGRVYNNERPVPLDLPDEKTKSILRDYGGNQMIWEGKEGEQFIRIDQQCGNEILMNGITGQESIQIRDKFGNQLHLGAASKSISLFSPSHNSGMVLGKSKHTISKSDDGNVTAGNSYGVHAGSSISVGIGFKTGFAAGSACDVWMGPKAAVAIGRTIEYSKGTKVTYASASSYSKSAEDSALQAEKTVAIDANERIWLLGGEKDKSQVQMTDAALRLTFQDSCGGRVTVNPPSWKSVAGTVAGTAINTAVAAGQMLGAVGESYGANVTSHLGKGLNLANDTVADVFDGGLPNVLGFTTVLFSGIEGHLEAKRKEAEQKANKNITSHDDPDGEIKLRATGVQLRSGPGRNSVIDIDRKSGSIQVSTKNESKGKVSLLAKDNIILTAGKPIVFSTPQHKYKKGKIDHKNLKVLE